MKFKVDEYVSLGRIVSMAEYSMKSPKVLVRLGYAAFENVLNSLHYTKSPSADDFRAGKIDHLTYVFCKRTGVVRLKIVPVPGDMCEMEEM